MLCVLTDIEYLRNIAQRRYSKYIFLFICCEFAYATNKALRHGDFFVNAGYVASAS